MDDEELIVVNDSNPSGYGWGANHVLEGICSLNPNGIPQQSPGLRGTSYPGAKDQTGKTPTGFRLWAAGRNPVGVVFFASYPG